METLEVKQEVASNGYRDSFLQSLSSQKDDKGEQTPEVKTEVKSEVKPEVKPETKPEVKTETSAESQPEQVEKPKSWEEVWNQAPEVQADPKEKEIEQKILAQYQDKLQLAEKLTNNELAMLMLQHADDPNFDLNSWLHGSTVDYSNANEETLLRAYAKQSGLEVSEEDIQGELEALKGKGVFEKKAWRDTILQHLPKPINIADKISEFKNKKAQESQEFAVKYNQFAEKVSKYADTKIGVNLDGDAVTKEEIENAKRSVLDGTYYLKDPKDPFSYDYERAIQDQVFAQRYRTGLGKIKEKAATEAKVQAAQERANASTDMVNHNTNPKGLTEEQEMQVKQWRVVFGANKEGFKDKMKELGINI